MNNVQDKKAKPSPRQGARSEQRERLIGCAEAAIAADGLQGLRARELARCGGFSLGAIYNLVVDLDELTLLVGQRTMAKLDTALQRAEGQGGAADEAGVDVGAQLIAWARAYAGFATEHHELWRALFEFRMATPRDFPDWFAAAQMQLFARLEVRLAPLVPSLDAESLRARARALFAAVHGIVALGIQGKLVALPVEAVDAELVAFIETYVAGLSRKEDAPGCAARAPRDAPE